MATTFNKFLSWTTYLCGDADLATDTLKVALTNTAPVNTNELLSHITEITAADYSAGGLTATTSSFGDSDVAGVAELVIGQPSFQASTATMGPFRYVVLYDDTVTGDPLIGWFDYGSSITLAVGEQFDVLFDNGVSGTGALTVT